MVHSLRLMTIMACMQMHRQMRMSGMNLPMMMWVTVMSMLAVMQMRIHRSVGTCFEDITVPHGSMQQSLHIYPHS